MRRLRVVVFVILVLTLPMLGQSTSAELFGGYSLERIAAGCGSDYRCGSNDTGATTNFNGWIVSLNAPFHESLGITAQFSGNYGYAGVGNGGGGLSSAHRYTYQFGPAYTFRWQHASAFVHTLVGGVTQRVSQGTLNGIAPSYTAFLWSVGGGLDLKVTNHVSVRAGQIDYERHNVPVQGLTASSKSSTNGLRYSAGVVLKF